VVEEKDIWREKGEKFCEVYFENDFRGDATSLVYPAVDAAFWWLCGGGGGGGEERSELAWV